MRLRITIAMLEIRNEFSRKLIYAKVTSKSATMPTAYSCTVIKVVVMLSTI